jgi:hypothetical protein
MSEHKVSPGDSLGIQVMCQRCGEPQGFTFKFVERFRCVRPTIVVTPCAGCLTPINSMVAFAKEIVKHGELNPDWARER